MRSLELFAGAGGLALGISRAGFAHTGVVEWDHDACSSMVVNRDRNAQHIREWPIIEADVRTIRFSEFGEDIDLLAGGVPSLGRWPGSTKVRTTNETFSQR